MTTKLINTGIAYSYYPNISNEERSFYSTTKKALFGFGVDSTSNYTTTMNHLNSVGVFARDTTVATDNYKWYGAAASFGGNRMAFAYGFDTSGSTFTRVSDVGVVDTTFTGLEGTRRYGLAAATYGTDKAIFGFGRENGGSTTFYNTFSRLGNTGGYISETSGSGVTRYMLAAATYGGDKVIFAYGLISTTDYINTFTLINNLGAFVSDNSGVGTARSNLAATGFGGDKAIFGYGYNGDVSNVFNTVSNVGVITSAPSSVGLARFSLAAAGYGGDRGMFAFGYAGGINYTNKVSNTGIVEDNVAYPTYVSGRYGVSAASYSS